MTWANVQSGIQQNGNTSSTTVAVTLASPVGNGNLICVSVGYASGTLSTPTVTDDKGNTYNAVDGAVNSATAYCWLTFYLAGIANGPKTITATFSGAQSYATIVVDEFSGGATGVALDGHAINAQNGPSGTDSVTSGSITPTTNGDLIYGSSVNIGGSGSTSGTGFTSGQNVASSFNTEYETQATVGAVAATLTPTGSSWFVTALMAFKPAAAVAPTISCVSNYQVYKDTAGRSGASPASISGVETGDLVLGFSYQPTGGAPNTSVGAFVSQSAGSTTQGSSGLSVPFAVAASAGSQTLACTGSPSVAAIFRCSTGAPLLNGARAFAGNTGTSITIPPLSLQNTSGSSLVVVCLAGDVASAGLNSQSIPGFAENFDYEGTSPVDEVATYISTTGLSSFPGATINGLPSGDYIAAVVEVMIAPTLLTLSITSSSSVSSIAGAVHGMALAIASASAVAASALNVFARSVGIAAATAMTSMRGGGLNLGIASLSVITTARSMTKRLALAAASALVVIAGRTQTLELALTASSALAHGLSAGRGLALSSASALTRGLNVGKVIAFEWPTAVTRVRQVSRSLALAASSAPAHVLSAGRRLSLSSSSLTRGGLNVGKIIAFEWPTAVTSIHHISRSLALSASSAMAMALCHEFVTSIVSGSAVSLVRAIGKMEAIVSQAAIVVMKAKLVVMTIISAGRRNNIAAADAREQSASAPSRSNTIKTDMN